jgi:hypothetical protein
MFVGASVLTSTIKVSRIGMGKHINAWDCCMWMCAPIHIVSVMPLMGCYSWVRALYCAQEAHVQDLQAPTSVVDIALGLFACSIFAMEVQQIVLLSLMLTWRSMFLCLVATSVHFGSILALLWCGFPRCWWGIINDATGMGQPPGPASHPACTSTLSHLWYPNLIPAGLAPPSRRRSDEDVLLLKSSTSTSGMRSNCRDPWNPCA